MKSPRVSIVTPSYNQREYLEHTILSVLEQGYPHLEYIVMDGGSTDGSVEIIKKYQAHLAYWQSRPDGGQARAINAGFGRATGDIFAFLNSDDFLLQGAIPHIVQLYTRYPQASGWVGGAYYVDADGYILQTRLPQKVGRAELADWEENWLFQPACFFSAKAARAVGFLNPIYENAFDFDFWLRIAALGELVPTSRILAAAIVHPDAKTQKYRLRMFEETQAIQRSYGYESLAQDIQSFIDAARSENRFSARAKLLYTVHTKKKQEPNHFVRLPGGVKDAK